MQLNYGLNAKVSQIVVLPDNSSTYILKFRYACNTNADFAASSARVLWNEQEVMKIEVHNNEVHMGEVKLTPIEGGNVLTFEGLGEVSNRGLAITDVGVHSDVKPNEKDILLQKLKDRRNRYQNKDDKKPGTVEIKDFTPAPPKTVTPNAPTIQ